MLLRLLLIYILKNKVDYLSLENIEYKHNTALCLVNYNLHSVKNISWSLY